MKKMIKILSFVICFMIILGTVVSATFTKITPQQPGDTAGLGTKAATIIGAIQWVGYLIAVGILVYIGIKYIMASAQEKADLKGNLVKYLVGAVLIAAATTIASWVFTAVGDNNSATGGGKNSTSSFLNLSESTDKIKIRE